MSLAKKPGSGVWKQEDADREISKILVQQLEDSQAGMLAGAEGLRRAATLLHMDPDAAAVELLNLAASMERAAGQWRDTATQARDVLKLPQG